VNDAAVYEGQSLTHDVTLTGSSSAATPVTVTLSNGSATLGTDTATVVTVEYANGSTASFTPDVNGQFTVTVPAGDTGFKVIVSSTDDTVLEGLESYTISVATPEQSTADTGTGTIVDDGSDPANPGQPGNPATPGYDNDLRASVNDAAVYEGQSLTHDVTLTGSSSAATPVTVTLSNGSATLGTDTATVVTVEYANGSTASFTPDVNGQFTVTVPAGDTGFKVIVSSTDDTVLEGLESYTISVATPEQSTADTGTGTIVDDGSDPANPGQPGNPATPGYDNDLRASVNDAAVYEGQSLTHDVTLTGSSSAATPVTVTLSNGSATLGTDTATVVTVEYANGSTASFTPDVNGQFTVTVPAGDTGFKVIVSSTDDTVLEGLESYTISVATPEQSTADTGTGTIVDDGSDPANPGQPGNPATPGYDNDLRASVNDAAVYEGQSLTHDVTLTGSSSAATPVTVTLSNGSATLGTDTATVVTVEYANGSTASFTPDVNGQFTVTVPAGDTGFKVIVSSTDDTVLEGLESYTISVATPEQSTADTGTGTIVDDGSDPANPGQPGNPATPGYDNDLRASVNDAAVYEGQSLTHDVTLTGSSSAATPVTVTLSNGSATLGTDTATVVTVEYANGSTASFTPDVNGQFTVTVPAGDTGFKVIVSSTDDTVLEGLESYTISVATPEQSTADTGTGTIVDDGSDPANPGQPGNPATPGYDNDLRASVNDAAVYEGQSLTHDVTLTGSSSAATPVTVTLSNGSATLGTDTATVVTVEYANGSTASFTPDVNGQFTVTVPAGDTGFKVIVSSTDDTVLEGLESYTISVATPEQSTADTGTGTIVDDGSDPANPGQPGNPATPGYDNDLRASVNDAAVYEGQSNPRRDPDWQLKCGHPSDRDPKQWQRDLVRHRDRGDG
jgi:hypothetical protein